jgi:hydrogenase nickel incorporation protein HypB
MDVLAYEEFDVDYFHRGVETLNPGLAFFPVSCKTGEGLETWFDWLRARVRERVKARQT